MRALLIQHLSEEGEEPGLKDASEYSFDSNLHVRCSMEKVLGRGFTGYREALCSETETKQSFYPAHCTLRERLHVL